LISYFISSIDFLLYDFPFFLHGTGQAGAGGVAAGRWRTVRGRSGR